MSGITGKRVKSVANRSTPMVKKDPFFSREKKEERFALFESRKLEVHKFTNLHWFVENGFEFPRYLIAQNLDKFCSLNGNIYPRLVKEFYSNLVQRGECWVTEVRNKRILVDQDSLEEVAGLQNTGLPTSGMVEDPEWKKYEMVSTYTECLRPGKEYDGQHTKAGHMKVNDRLLHYLMVYIILPRLHNKATPSIDDLRYMFALKKGIQLCWANVILNFMVRRFREPGSALPYPALVSKLIEEAGVDLSNEAQLVIRDGNDKIDRTTLKKMKIRRIDGVWTWAGEEGEEEPQANQASEAPIMPDYMAHMQGFLVDQFGQIRQDFRLLDEKVDSGFARLEAQMGNLRMPGESSQFFPES